MHANYSLLSCGSSVRVAPESQSKFVQRLILFRFPLMLQCLFNICFLCYCKIFAALSTGIIYEKCAVIIYLLQCWMIACLIAPFLFKLLRCRVFHDLVFIYLFPDNHNLLKGTNLTNVRRFFWILLFFFTISISSCIAPGAPTGIIIRPPSAS